jgi:hypothetical protein
VLDMMKITRQEINFQAPPKKITTHSAMAKILLENFQRGPDL